MLGALQAERDALDGADILRDVFAVDSVAARRADRQAAVIVNQLNPESIELHFRDIFDVGVGFQ